MDCFDGLGVRGDVVRIGVVQEGDLLAVGVGWGDGSEGAGHVDLAGGGWRGVCCAGVAMGHRPLHGWIGGAYR